MRKERKKVLLLTLGTGNLSNATESASYILTQYMINGFNYQKDGEDKKTSFVAEPIINFFRPNEVFILGTVKSVWHQLYASITTVNIEDTSYIEDVNYQKLVKIEQDNGIDTDIEKLAEFEISISDIFQKIDEKMWKEYVDDDYDKPNIHVLLTKYGINGNELNENYGILKRIESYMSEDVCYEVAFDITHSFRSLPIYNLIIFNYIKNITKYNIVISHVYYGNIDARYELNNVAPIVDLGDLIDVLDLTSGVSEFKNTGNATSILPLIDDKDELRSVLYDFDLSTQLNAFGKIGKSLIKLEELCKKNDGSEDRYTGVREMISTVIEEKFKGECSESFDVMTSADMKFMLAQWFLSQNRIGLGLATGIEALRDINTPAFMESRGYDPSLEKEYRVSAENHFIKVAKDLSSKYNKSHLENVVCDLGINLRYYKDIRNMFAHSLSDLKNRDDADLSEIRNDIDNFKQLLKKLKKEYDNETEKYYSLFEPKESKKAYKSKNKRCRIILDCKGTCEYGNYLRSSNGINYDVYYLNTEVRESFFGGWDGRNYECCESAFFLTKYLEKQLLDILSLYDSINIILFNCDNPEREIVFRVFLEGVANDRVLIYAGADDEAINSYKKTRLMISMNDYEEEYREQQSSYFPYEDIMMKKLECFVQD